MALKKKKSKCNVFIAQASSAVSVIDLTCSPLARVSVVGGEKMDGYVAL